MQVYRPVRSHHDACFPAAYTSIQKTYPRMVKKGRPKFKLLSADQEAMGHFPLSNEGARVNAQVNRFLRPYQQEGIKFLFVVRSVLAYSWLTCAMQVWSVSEGEGRYSWR